MDDQTTITSQADWERVCERFRAASRYRAFTADYTFNPSSVIRLTGEKAVREVIP